MINAVMFRKFLEPLSTSALPSYRPGVVFAVLASLSGCTFHLTPAWLGQSIRRNLCNRRPCKAVCQSRQPIPDSTSRFTESVRTMACVIWVSLWEASPRYCVSYCFCLHGQTEGRVSVGTTVFVYSPTALLDCEPVPCDWAIRVDFDAMWLAVGFDERLYFCIVSSAVH